MTLSPECIENFVKALFQTMLSVFVSSYNHITLTGDNMT